MSKFYLAARMSRACEMQGVRRDLLYSGRHLVTSRWIDEKPKPEDEEAIEAANISRRDMSDVMIADALILFGEKPRECPTRHGRLVEFGIALGLGHDCYVIGYRENVFTYQAKFFEDWPSLLSVLDPELWKRNTPLVKAEGKRL